MQNSNDNDSGLRENTTEEKIEASVVKIAAIHRELENPTLSDEERDQLTSKLKTVEEERDNFRSNLIEKTVVVNRIEPLSTLLHPFRLIAKHLSPTNVLMQSTINQAKVKQDVEEVIEKVRKGEPIHPYLNNMGIDLLLKEQFINGSGKLTNDGLDTFLFWAKYELTRPSKS